MSGSALLIAPSGPLHPDMLGSGIERLGELEIPLQWPEGWSEGLMARCEHLAGSDEHRADQLFEAIRLGPAAIWMARGGYGGVRTLERLAERHPDAFDGPPVPLWGFSDGTVLLAAWDRAGWPAWHGPPITQLPRLDPEDTARLRAAWHARHVAPFEELETLVPGRAEAPLAGGNLCVLASILGTPFEARFEDRIVILEDTGEPVYKIDRLFTQLRLAGAFEGARALVLGQFTALQADQQVAVRALFAAEAPRLGIPVVTGLPVGHNKRNAPLPFGAATGATAILDAPADGPARLTIEW